jgi:hypothetical protein
MRQALFTLILLGAAVASAQTYRWVDEKGVVHYSDRPQPGAEKVELEPVQTYQAPPARTSAAAAGSASSAQARRPGEPAPEYARCEISTPTNDQSFVNVQSVSAAVRVEPPLRAGHTITLVMDGRAVQDPGSAVRFSISPIYRGTHSLMTVVQDATGLTLCRSPVITFHVRQASLLQPNRRAATAPRTPTAPPARPPSR